MNKPLPDTAAPDSSAESPELTLERLKDRTYLPSYIELMGLGKYADEGFALITNRPGCERCEIFTREYIAGLCDCVLEERARTREGSRFSVLEVGAGDGNLGYFLTQELTRRGERDVHVLSNDSGDWPQEPVTPDYHIEYMDGAQAAKLFKPDLIVESWMPGDLDLTSSFRRVDSVRAYILIGPANMTFCGQKWETWGIGRPEEPPYETDGFEKEKIHIAPQLNNSSLAPEEDISETYIFRRLTN